MLGALGNEDILMDDEELMDAFAKIVKESISNTAIKNKILHEVKSRLEVRGIFSAKGILAEINKHSDLKISEESALLN